MPASGDFERLLIVPTGVPGHADWSLCNPDRIRNVGEERPFWLFTQSSGCKLFESRSRSPIVAGNICLFHRSCKDSHTSVKQVYALGVVGTVAHDPDACASLARRSKTLTVDSEKRSVPMEYHLQLAKLVPVNWSKGWLSHTLGLSSNDNLRSPRMIELSTVAPRAVSASLPALQQRIRDALAGVDIMAPGAVLPQLPCMSSVHPDDPLCRGGADSATTVSGDGAGAAGGARGGHGVGKRLWRPSALSAGCDGGGGGGDDADESTDSDVSELEGQSDDGGNDSDTVMDAADEDDDEVVASHGGRKRKARHLGPHGSGDGLGEPKSAPPAARKPSQAVAARRASAGRSPSRPAAGTKNKYGTAAVVMRRFSIAARAALHRSSAQLVPQTARVPGLFLYSAGKAPMRLRGRAVSKFKDALGGTCNAGAEVRQILDPEHPAVRVAAQGGPDAHMPLGLFAAARIPKATIIGEITGSVCTRAELVQLQSLAAHGRLPARTFELQSSRTWGPSSLFVVSQPEPAQRVDLMGCINDYRVNTDGSASDDFGEWPNVTQLEVLHVTDDRQLVPRIFLQTTQEIEPGEEITMDLGAQFWQQLAESAGIGTRTDAEADDLDAEPLVADRPPEPDPEPAAHFRHSDDAAFHPRAAPLSAPAPDPSAFAGASSRPAIDPLTPAFVCLDDVLARPAAFVQRYAAVWQHLQEQTQALQQREEELSSVKAKLGEKDREIGHLRALLKASWQHDGF